MALTEYRCYQMEDGAVYIDNPSPMYASELEDMTNKLAGEKITQCSKMPGDNGGFFGGFMNSFKILPEKVEVFRTKVLPNLLCVQPNIIKF